MNPESIVLSPDLLAGSAYAFFLGRRDYPTNTADLDTNEVEDFIINFYTQYNRRFGTRY